MSEEDIRKIKETELQLTVDKLCRENVIVDYLKRELYIREKEIKRLKNLIKIIQGELES